MNTINRLFIAIGLLIIFNSTTKNNFAIGQSWGESIGSIEALQNHYLANAIHINEAGGVINGSESIINFWKAQGIEISSSESTFEIKTTYKSDHVYEIGSFTTKDKIEYSHLLIEQLTDSISKRKLEFIAQKNIHSVNLSDIDKRRKDWVEYCNSHDAEGLVQNLYTENAVYYNHRPVLIGHSALTQEYQYMNNPKYSLRLFPLHVEVVSDSLVFEIGQCDGSYKGKYLLVWQKGTDGIWRVLMDSNI